MVAKKLDFSQIKGREGVDMSELNMLDTKIEIVEIRDYSKKDENQVNIEPLLLNKKEIETESLRLIVQTSLLKEGTKIRATSFFTLFRDMSITEGCNISFSKNESSNITKFLKHFNISNESLANVEKLVGAKCKTILRKGDNDKEKLEIYYGQ